MMLAAAKAAVITGLAGVMLAGLTGVVVGIKAYSAGREKELGVQQRIIRNMVDEHRAALDSANAKTEATEKRWKLMYEGAIHAQETERAAARRQLAAVNDDRGRLREQLAAVASGGVEASVDTVGACRDRASALGDVLDQALHAHAVCTAEAEELAAGVRALRSAWPSASSVELSP